MANAINTTSMTFDAATEQALRELSKTHGRRAARRELSALVDAAIAQRADSRSVHDLAVEFGVSEYLVAELAQ